MYRKTLLSSLFTLALASTGYAVDYSSSHKFELDTSLHDIPINQITFPGSHNSFNTSGTSPNCAPRSTSDDDFIEALKTQGLKATDYLSYIKIPKINIFGIKIGYDFQKKLKVGPADNKNVHISITDQVVNKGIRFLEIDVYHANNGNWCVFHAAGGDSRLDGNSFYFSDIINEIANAYNAITPHPLFIKFDGGHLTKDILEAELKKVNLENAVYRHPGGDQPIPTINDLRDIGKRLIIVSGPLSWNMQSAGTSPKHKSRTGALNQPVENPNNADFIRWNAFGLDDAFGYGSTGDADYIHARLVGHGIEKWVQGGHRINHLVVDFPSRISVGMSAMRAANILNQVRSIKGYVTDGSSDSLLKDVQFRVTMDNVNLSDDWHQAKGQPYNQEALISGKLAGTFDFPRPEEQAVRIEPFKEGFRFEPTSIYINPFVNIESISFRGFKGITPNSIASRHTFVLQDGHVDLDPGLGVVNKQVVVKDITRLNYVSIINKRSGLCVGVEGSHLYNGTPVTMQYCDGSENQRWIYSLETGRFQTALGNYCLDTAGTDHSGHEQKLWECTDHPNLKYTFAGQRIVPQSHQNVVALDSQGTVAGAPLIIWNRLSDDYHDNRNWIMERQYVVSANGDNTVSDASKTNNRLKFLIVNDKVPHCLTADGHWHTAFIKSKHCKSQAPKNMLWTFSDDQFKLNDRPNLCLSHKGQLHNEAEPEIGQCRDKNVSRWSIAEPYWGGTASTTEPAAIFAGGVFIDYPRDDFIRMYGFTDRRDQQGWHFIPIYE